MRRKSDGPKRPDWSKKERRAAEWAYRHGVGPHPDMTRWPKPLVRP